ncbi:SRPBCC family protein [Hyphococcus flavus]|uniref:SRPBCC family protein n=1 Tax=Hyphococcus flavus TaxID=1866326 RepID=A0AAF0CH35_9PROT|nr:SRPBCC family protein [Hyphococcus flavus]WDI32998.1 SRPBCC family protein [Hyphococcus flavus]
MLNKLLGGLIGFVAALFLLGYTLPDRTQFQREIIVDAPVEDVYSLISDFHEWEAWSPWSEVDQPTENVAVEGGIGQQMIWHGGYPELAGSRHEIVALAAPGHVVTRLDLGPMGEADAAFSLSPLADGRTKVTWTYHAQKRENVPFYLQPIATYMGYLTTPLLSPTYEQGLANLKRAAEAD